VERGNRRRKECRFRDLESRRAMASRAFEAPPAPQADALGGTGARGGRRSDLPQGPKALRPRSVPLHPPRRNPPLSVGCPCCCGGRLRRGGPPPVGAPPPPGRRRGPRPAPPPPPPLSLVFRSSPTLFVRMSCPTAAAPAP